MGKKRWMGMIAIVLGLGGLAAAPAPSKTLAGPPLWALAEPSSAASAEPSLYRSIDGGLHWSRLSAGFSGFGAPVMLTGKDGFASGVQANGTSYYESTQNGGVSWSRTNTRDVAMLGFLNSLRGWRSMTNAPATGPVQWRLLTTDNGGATWTKISTRSLPQLSVTSAPFFISPKVGWILDIIGPEWNVFKTTNGGRSFTRLTSHGLGGAGVSPVGVTFTTDRRGWTLVDSIGAGGAGLNELLTTNDGGRRWTADTGLPKVPTVEHFDFLDTEQGFVLTPVRTVSGRDGFVPHGTRLYQTADGGKIWTLRYQSSRKTLTDVAFITAKVAYATGRHGVLESYDGGRTWKLVYRNPDLTFLSLWSTNRVSRLSQ